MATEMVEQSRGKGIPIAHSRFTNRLMKSSVLLAQICMAVGLTFGALGQTPPDHDPKPGSANLQVNQEKGEEIIRQYDKNGDGIIDANERKAAREALEKSGILARPQVSTNFTARQDLFRRFDTNHDGKIDEKERTALHAELAKMRGLSATNTPAIERPVFDRKAVFKEFDKDGDGRLNDEERKAAIEAMRARYLGTNSAASNNLRSRELTIKRFDTNGDGVIDEQERKAAVEAFRARRQQNSPTRNSVPKNSDPEPKSDSQHSQ